MSRNAHLCFANDEDPEGINLDHDLSFPKWTMTVPDKEERQIITKMINKACTDSFHDWQVYESYYAKNAKI